MTEGVKNSEFMRSMMSLEGVGPNDVPKPMTIPKKRKYIEETEEIERECSPKRDSRDEKKEDDLKKFEARKNDDFENEFKGYLKERRAYEQRMKEFSERVRQSMKERKQRRIERQERKRNRQGRRNERRLIERRRNQDSEERGWRVE